MAFEAYDYDDDGQIQDLDLFSTMKVFAKEEELFSKVFTPDFLAVENIIEQKRNSRGLKNSEVK